MGPLPRAAPTTLRTTRQATGTAWPALYLPPTPPPMPQKRKLPPLSPPVAHPTQPPTSFPRPTRMPWTFRRMKQVPPRPLPHPPSQALSPPWSLLLQGPLFALPSWVPRDPPPGPVAPSPMGSPATPPPPENSWPRAGKCLTTHPLHLGAGPPHVTSSAKILSTSDAASLRPDVSDIVFESCASCAS